MNKQIRKVDDAKGIVQITTYDERWYARPEDDPVTKLPTYSFVPSVTWICGHYPKSIGFYKWLANTGWDESQALKNAAGDKGSKIHLAIADLHAGNAVEIDSKYPVGESGQAEELTAEEYEAVLSYAEWFEKVKPEILGFEYTVWNTAEGYAGTVDLKCRIDGEVWLIDVKSSKDVWPEHELQVSAYKHSEGQEDVQRLAILQVGYARNKIQKFKFTEIEDVYPLFLAAKQIWTHETAGQKPSQKDLPFSVKLDLPQPGDRASGTTPIQIDEDAETAPKAAKPSRKAA
ncbi:MAG TPA: hypothetical protein VLC46_26755 [Thermoanaerobaculia bacterium]|jgi:hypothetical protein|nr:hypothetical protein [Thermoanaerobaculia bacterium]